MTPISTATAVLVMMAVVVAVLAAAANAQAPAPAPATSDGQLSDPFFHRCFVFSLLLHVLFSFLGGIADAGSLLWKECTMQLRCLRRRTQIIHILFVFIHDDWSLVRFWQEQV
jgi:hypothetical protein